MRLRFLILPLLALLTAIITSLTVAPSEPSTPEDNRFTPVVLTPEGALDEPMVFQVLPGGTTYIIERHGRLKKFDPATQTVSLIDTIPVFVENEQGLVGFTLDPNFAKNHWIYLYYALPNESKMVLTRWELVNDELRKTTRKVLLEILVDRAETSHTGGGMCWDAKGNLYLTVGNNSGNSYVAQTDERPDRERWDDQRGAANTNDLRGKILRIHPEPNGTYTIPDGNLFPAPPAPVGGATGASDNRLKAEKGTSAEPPLGGRGALPEIYIMGTRNAWRPSLDSRTGWLYWGEIGPDADKDTDNAPRGYDEFNQARKPGFFGWPYFIGDNSAYPIYDFAAQKPGPKLDPNRPQNRSRNNTGLTDLPPAQPAFIYYPYAVSEKFPLVGSSSRAAIGGPVFRRQDFQNPKRPFPAYYEGKWLIADLSRFWIMAVTMDTNGNYQSMERFAPDYHPRQPIDLKFGPDGDLYVLEYGGNTSRSAVEARLVRIEYNAGNRKPVVQASVDKKGGALPLTVTLSSTGTKDYDGDALRYEWRITASGQPARMFNAPNPTVTFAKAGIYTAALTVTDAKGLKNSQSLQVVAGNEPPVVSIDVVENSSFFFPGKTFAYAVDVTDREDGSLADGKIDPAQVFVDVDYVPEGFNLADMRLGNAKVDVFTQFAVAKAMMAKTDCNTCHALNAKAVGPSFVAIAQKYKGDAGAMDRLVAKIRQGGAGVWGETAMPAHPTLTLHETQTITNYILNSTTKTVRTLPLKGPFLPFVPEGETGNGSYLVWAAYTDRPTNVPSQTAQIIRVLRSPRLIPTDADVISGGAVRDQLDEFTFLTTKPGSHISYRNLDLTGIRQIEFRPNWHLYDIYTGGEVEIRLDSPTGEVIGTAEVKEEYFNIKKMPGGMDAFWGREPRNDKNGKTTPARATIRPIKGRHDLYFVFKRAGASPKTALFPLASIRLYDEVR